VEYHELAALMISALLIGGFAGLLGAYVVRKVMEKK